MNTTSLKDAIAYFDDFLEYKFPYLDVPSLSIAIRYQGTLVYSKAYGKSDVENNIDAQISTPYRVASNSKMFTAVSLLQLKDAGKLRLDDSVATYLPWLKEHKDSRWSTVTIRNLLSHAAGVARDSSRSGFWSLQYEFPDSEELKEVILGDNLVYDPDTQMKYSNYGFGLLGEVIEAISGSSYREYVIENIIKPLELKQTRPDYSLAIGSELAVGYTDKTVDGRRLPIDGIDTQALSSATGFVSTPSDITSFMSSVLSDGGVIISSQSSNELQRIHSRVKYGRGTKQYYGLGFELGDIHNEMFISHGGGFPGQVTESMYVPSKELAISVVMNGRGNTPMDIVKSFMSTLNWFTQNYVDQPKHDLTSFTVRYAHLWGATDIVGYGNSLVSFPSIVPLDFDYAEVLERIDDKTVKIINTSSFMSPGEPIRFNRKSNGVVESIDDQGTICELVHDRDNRWKSLTRISLPKNESATD